MKKLMADVTEEVLIARMEERFREGAYSEELAEFFERGEEEFELPVFARGTKKQRRHRATREREGRPTERSEATPSSDLAPLANRGLTFHDNPNDPTACPRIMGGYDGGTTIGLYGHWPTEDAEPRLTFQALAKAKKAAEECEKDDAVIFEMHGMEFVMKKTGAKDGAYYRYVLEKDGVKYYIHHNAKGEIQPIRIVYMTEGLHGRDLFFKHAETMEILGTLGFVLTGEKLSRVDKQVMVEIPTDELIPNKARIVCPAQSGSIHFKGMQNPLETLRLGTTGLLQICIYNKAAELQKLRRSNPLKYALMLQESIGEEWEYDPKPLTRIEFRIGRELLRSMKIDTMDDLLSCEKSLASYCVKWFRILGGPRKKGHTHEQPVSPEWQTVREAFEKWFPGVEGHDREVRRRYKEDIKCEPEHLKKQALGCLSTYIAMRLGRAVTLSDAKSMLYSIVCENAQKIFTAAVDRAERLGIRTGLNDRLNHKAACDIEAVKFRKGEYVQLLLEL